jgi:hypothetical protein
MGAISEFGQNALLAQAGTGELYLSVCLEQF